MKTFIIFTLALVFVFPVFGNGTPNMVHSRSESPSADVVVHLFNVKTYKTKVLPAYRTYSTTNDARPVIALLRECLRVLDANPQVSKRMLLNAESVKDDIGIIEGTVYYTPDQGKTSNQGNSKMARTVRQEYARYISWIILELLCVPYDKGIDPQQDMTNSALVNYLYDRSRWITDVFTGSGKATGLALKYAIGESSEPFTRQAIAEFDRELSEIEAPQDAGMQREFENLRAIVKKALADPDLTLLYSVT